MQSSHLIPKAQNQFDKIQTLADAKRPLTLEDIVKDALNVKHKFTIGFTGQPSLRIYKGIEYLIGPRPDAYRHDIDYCPEEHPEYYPLTTIVRLGISDPLRPHKNLQILMHSLTSPFVVRHYESTAVTVFTNKFNEKMKDLRIELDMINVYIKKDVGALAKTSMGVPRKAIEQAQAELASIEKRAQIQLKDDAKEIRRLTGIAMFGSHVEKSFRLLLDTISEEDRFAFLFKLTANPLLGSLKSLVSTIFNLHVDFKSLCDRIESHVVSLSRLIGYLTSEFVEKELRELGTMWPPDIVKLSRLF
jgi:hypothetical protein